MVERHPLTPQARPPIGRTMPKIWLFSDERMENPLLQVAASLPVGSGIVLRHDALSQGARWRLARRLMRLARARGLMVLIADQPTTARAWGLHGVHLRRGMAHRAGQARALGLVISMPVHDRAQARTARRCDADMAFISPLYETRSHAGERALGMARWLRLAREVGARHIAALGGMDAARGRALQRAGQQRAEQERTGRQRAGQRGSGPGWAAIDALDQACGQQQKRRRAARRRAL